MLRETPCPNMTPTDITNMLLRNILQEQKHANGYLSTLVEQNEHRPPTYTVYAIPPTSTSAA